MIKVVITYILSEAWPCTDDSLWEMQQTNAYTYVYIYCIINNVAPYVFRPPIVVIFTEQFLMDVLYCIEGQTIYK